MLKFLTILKKDFKLLFRSKSSAFVVFLGPILITALIMLSFSTSSVDYQMSVGLVNVESDSLTDLFLSSLDEESYVLIKYHELDQCVADIKSSKINLCLTFEDNGGVINDNSVEINDSFDSNESLVVETVTVDPSLSLKSVTFHVDPSRTNVVQKIVSSLKEKIGSTSKQVTLSKNEDLLLTIGKKASELSVVQLNTSDLVKEIPNSVDNIELNSEKINEVVKESEKDLESSNDDLVEESEEYFTEISESQSLIYTSADDLIDKLEDTVNLSSSLIDNYEDLDDVLTEENTDITEAVDEISWIIDSLNKKIEDMNSDLSSSNTQFAGLVAQTDEIINQSEEIRSLVIQLNNNLEEIGNTSNLLYQLSMENIQNPFDISIEKVISDEDHSLFMFPYYIILMILFVGMMLSSSLVIVERRSLALFRNMTSPTNFFTHFGSMFLTNLIVIMSQLALVLYLSKKYIGISVMGNFNVILAILTCAVFLFVLLGHLIGYLFKTQESSTIAFISLAGTFSFLSNLILPVESFSASIKEWLLYNPYMLLSEMFKRALLFDATFMELSKSFILLLGYIVVLFVLVLAVQKFSMFRSLIRLNKLSVLKRPHITREKFFRLENGVLIKSLDDLKTSLEGMTSKEYNHYIQGRNNEFSAWINTISAGRILSIKVYWAETRRDVIRILEGHLSKDENEDGWFRRFFFK